MKRVYKYGIISRYWWLPVLTGLICLGLGIWCLCDPSQSLPVLAYVFAGCLTVAGCAYTGMALSSTRSFDGWGWMLALGLIELVCGIWLWCLPMPALVITFMYVIGVWILVVAINAVCESIMMSYSNPFWIIWAILLLFCTIAFAIAFLNNPVITGITEWIWLGISLITYGVYRISLGYRIRSVGRNSDGMI